MKVQKLLTGIIVANVFAMTLIGFTKWIIAQRSLEMIGGIFVFSDFVIVPALMGIIAAYFWRDLNLSGGKYTLYAVYNAVAAVAGAYLFLDEGYICLIIISPLLMGFTIAGTFIGKVMFRRNRNTLNVSILSLLFVIITVDSLTTNVSESMVSDTIVIHAPPEKVWQYVVAYEPNNAKEDYWLFQIGMPSPVQSTADAYCEGAGRKCIFSNGYVFEEKMVVFQPGKNLTFDVTDQPKDPEIMGHIDILRGQFLLKDNGDGTTTLTGNSWYRLYVFPAWYFNTWAASITRNVHLRVMEHIKILSEKNV
ncbi:MAG TPA: hypothetical protein VGC65_02075 [Bacteroidia bacterium]|jgi:uncharacterized protein YndB with AHSA1/START domain